MLTCRVGSLPYIHSSSVFVFSRAKVESRNNLETYLYNLKASYEDSLKDKIAEDDLEELKSAVEAGLEVCTSYQGVRTYTCVRRSM